MNVAVIDMQLCNHFEHDGASVLETSGAAEDFTADLIKSLNKERGTQQ